ncbi:MAG: ABC transporter substrate-binding protein [Gammaproteobacteria bacterium]
MSRCYPLTAVPASLRGWLSVIALLMSAFVSVPACAAPTGPRAVVRATSERLLVVLQQQGAADRGQLYQAVDRIILPNMDFRRMSRWVLGVYWRRASPDQRKHFVAEFRTLLVRTYVTALEQYHDQKIRCLPVAVKPGATDVTVRTQILPANGPSVPVAYRMHLAQGQWKAYDVTIDGMSLVANYRASFAGQVQAGGLDRLIQQLATRNRQGSAS